MDNGELMVVRPFLPEDQPAAQALILAGLAAHFGWLDSTLNPDLNDIAASYRHSLFLVMYDGERLVGTGALVPEGEGAGRIVRMSVDSSQRRKGYGRALLQALIAAAPERGYTHILLETNATWDDAIAFYEANGFRCTLVTGGEAHFEYEVFVRY